LLILGIIGCGGQTPARTEGAAAGGAGPGARKNLVIGILQEPPGWTPWTTIGTVGGAHQIIPLARRTLTNLDGDGLVRPDLAMSVPSTEAGDWRVNADGTMEQTWRIDPAARGHDGAPVTADDFLLGWEILQRPDLPPAVSSAHAALAQTFFCIAVCIALFTGRRWVEEVPQVELDRGRPSLITLSLLSIFLLYVQLILGAMFRHHGLSWWPHVLHAVLVTFVLTWTAIRALTLYSRIEAVRVPAITVLGLLIAQLCLGFLAFLTRVAWGHDAVQPELPMVLSTVAHVAVGALLLATTVVLAIQIWRHVPVAFEERIPARDRKPVTV